MDASEAERGESRANSHCWRATVVGSRRVERQFGGEMRKGTFIAGTVFMLLMLTSILMGQAQIGGTLRGTVSDPQGAVVPGAQLTLTNPATGVMRATTSDGAGNFQFVDVPPASYDIRVALTGFQTATFQNVVVNLNEVRVLNAQLAVGAMTQEVTVSGTAESVVPQETTLRATVGERDLQQLPLNGRDFQQLVLYAPGVVRGAGANGQGSGFNVAGARGTVNNFLIDGGDANDPEVPFGTATAGGFTNGLPIDAIAQFTVITSNASAEIGRNSGATVNVVTKSGTNQVHGSVWEYHRDKSLDARNFFDPAKKSPFIQNQFGFYVGGPIWKNKTFFSGSYEGFRQVQTASNVVFVPTPSFTSSISNRLVKQIFSAYPQPAAGTIDPTNTFGTSTTQVNNGGNQDAYFVRVDHNLNQRNQLFFTFNYTPTTAQPGAQGGNGIPGTNVGLNYKNWHGVTNWNSTFGNNKLNDFRVVFQRNLLGFPLDAAPAALLQAGQLRTAGPFAWQPFSSDPGSPNGVPSISFLDQQFGSLGWSNNFPQGRVSNTFEYDDTFSWTHGKHQIKFGGSASRIQENDDFGANIRPVLSFLNTKTGLLNTESQFTYAGNQPTKYFRETDLGFFVQDTWRLTQRLNLDLGLRYELDTPLREKFNQLSNVALLDANGKPEPCARIPQNGQLSNLAIIVPHQFGLDAYCTYKNNLAPRVGFAWDIFVDSKTVVRGSYGIFYDRIFTNALANARFSPPFTIPYTLSGITYDGTIGPTTLTPTAVVSPTAIDPSLVTPYTQRWNLTLSRALDANTVLNVSYVGAKALKLAQNLNPNFGAAFADAFRPTNATTPAARSAADLANNIIRGPFGNINLRTSHAYSNFDGLEVNANHRYSHGLTFQASYVWSHSLDTISDEIAGNADSAAPQATLFNLLAPLMTPTSSCSAANGTPSGAAGQT